MEFLFVIVALAFLGVLAVGFLKALLWLVVLPVKLGFWLVKGAFGFALMIVIGVLCVCAVAILPVLVSVVAIPVIAVACGVIALIKLVS